MFTGNFHYELVSESTEERFQLLQPIVANLPQNLATYRELIDSKFWAENKDEIVAVLPAVAIR